MARSKRITDEQHHGGRGETLAQLLVEEMGHEWHPTGRNEAGIDATIELRHNPSGEMTAQVILCQVKSGSGELFDETEEGFSWRADARDLRYWENSNAPVIVIIVDLATREGWWRAIDEAFPDAYTRASRVVRFDKRRDCLNGAPGEVLWEVVRRERDRRAVAARMAVAGPYSAVGLGDDLNAAQADLDNGRWLPAAKRWNALADAAEAKGLDRRLVWPAREQAARALEQGGRRPQAGKIWLRLAGERVEDDDPNAAFNVSKALWYGAPSDDFDVVLMHQRAELPEAGADALDGLRQVLKTAITARQRQAAAAALVDALVFFGYRAEALNIADAVLGKRHDTRTSASSRSTASTAPAS